MNAAERQEAFTISHQVMLDAQGVASSEVALCGLCQTIIDQKTREVASKLELRSPNRRRNGPLAQDDLKGWPQPPRDFVVGFGNWLTRNHESKHPRIDLDQEW